MQYPPLLGGNLMFLLPKKSAAYNLRFASGVIAIVQWCIFDPGITTYLKEFNLFAIPIGVAAVIVLGILIYYFYRVHLFKYLLALADYLGADSSRNFIRSKYVIPGGPIVS